MKKALDVSAVPDKRPQARDEFGFLDSVRGIAAFVVVIWHLLLGFYPQYCLGHASPNPFIQIFYSGPFAVEMFFVLSGFVLSLSSVRGGGIDTIRAAVVRRYIRLAGPILASVVASYCILLSDGYFNLQVWAILGQDSEMWLGRWNTFSPSLFTALDEGLFLSFFGHRDSATYNNVLWTMQIEFIGSLFIYSMNAFLGKLRNRGFLYVIIGLILIRMRYHHIFAFYLGMMLCEMFGGRKPTFFHYTLRNAIGFALILTGYGIATWDEAYGVNFFLKGNFIFKFAYSFAAFCIIAGVCFSDLLQSLLNIRVFTFLGRISFPLYLVHVIVELSLGCWVFLAFINMGYDKQAAFFAAAAATITVSILAGWLGALTIEPFSIWLGKWVYVRFFKQADIVEKTDLAVILNGSGKIK